MKGHLQIDERLMARAQEMSGTRSKGGMVNLAMKEFVERRESARAVRLFGSVEFAPQYDYLKERRGK